MESSRCSALFMAALFSLYRCRFNDSIGSGSCDIFPTQRFAYDQSSVDIVLELFLCSLLTTALSIFPLAFEGIPLDV